jgi:Spy/CpxP family protein refolding chaperone
MARTNSIHGFVAAVGLLAGLALTGTSALAETNPPAASTDQGHGMMPDGMNHGGMMNMMMNRDMQQKMSRMMDNCNRMMESMIPNKENTPTTPHHG